ncbi:7tm 1 domain containing protein [Trichuris trichiura]|uniref:7tm 1 domain containing protein n=1 Tax=Trichuris trichiura TaxID=36087 RepID=A0A077Z1C5_TRITR|nr:7tm 1 domain containing protein [Trichuris trichiura]
MTDFNASGCRTGIANDDMLIEEAFWLKQIVFGPVLAAFTIVAVASNSACIIVLHKSQQWPRMNLCLIALAAWEIVLICSSFFLYSLPMLLYQYAPTHGNYVETYAYWYTLANTANQASIWVVVVMAVDRYFAICSPFKHRRFENRMKGRILGVVSVFAIIHGFPRFFEVSIVRCPVMPNKTNVATVMASGLQQNYTYRVLYKIIGGLLLYSVGPFLTLSFVAVQVSKHLSKYATTRRKLVGIYSRNSGTSNSFASTTSEKTRDQNREQLFLIIIFKFLICHSLPTALDIMETACHESVFNTEIVNNLVDVSNVLVTLNGGCNVLIYMFCSQNFRQQFGKHIFRMKRFSHDSSRQSTRHIYRQGTLISETAKPQTVL